MKYPSGLKRSQVVDPIFFGGISGESKRVIFFKNVFNTSQASPSTPSMPATGITTYSNKDNDYTSTTNGIKTVAKIDGILPRDPGFLGSNSALILDCGAFSGSGPYPLVGSANIHWPDGQVVPKTVALETWIRIWPVIQDFDDTIITWNLWETTPPNFGSPIEYAVMEWYLAATLNQVPGPSFPAYCIGAPRTIPVPRTVGDDIYGFYIESKTSVVATGSFALPTWDTVVSSMNYTLENQFPFILIQPSGALLP